MKVLYDHQMFERQSFGGITRYFYELMNSYYNNNSLKFKLSLLNSDNHYLKDAPFSHHISSRRIPSLPGKRAHYYQQTLLSSANLLWSRHLIGKGDYDIFHPTYYDPYFVKYLNKRPYVLTVYDMIHELYPDLYRGDPTSEQKHLVIENATRIIAISESTKADIITFFDTDPGKIEVVHLASSLDAVVPDTGLELPQRYILFVGNRTLYKNFTLFIQSVQSLLKTDRELYVICAGAGSFSEAETEMLKDLGIQKQVLHYPIDDSILARLYARAEVFVFPSLYEGFGIPMLEAFSCGAPVAASRSSSLPEVGGDAAYYFDPKSPPSIADTVAEIVYSKSIQASLREKGYQRLKQFSWDKCAEETKKVYERIV